MLKAEIIEVNERKYRVTQLAPSKALPMLGQVIKHGTPLFSSLSSISEAFGAPDETQEKAVATITGNLSSIDPDVLSKIIIDLVRNVFSVEKSTLISDPDMFFAEHPEDLIPLAVKVGIFQFRPFLTGFADSLNLVGEKNELKSPN